MLPLSTSAATSMLGSIFAGPIADPFAGRLCPRTVSALGGIGAYCNFQYSLLPGTLSRAPDRTVGSGILIPTGIDHCVVPLGRRSAHGSGSCP